jgi:hypothetical protein
MFLFPEDLTSWFWLLLLLERFGFVKQVSLLQKKSINSLSWIRIKYDKIKGVSFKTEII